MTKVIFSSRGLLNFFAAVLPKKVKDFLEKLAELNGINVEDMFRQEIIAILKNFREGGFFEKWTENALKTAEQIQKLAIEQFDC